MNLRDLISLLEGVPLKDFPPLFSASCLWIRDFTDE
jgi:hypothetical protein